MSGTDLHLTTSAAAKFRAAAAATAAFGTGPDGFGMTGNAYVLAWRCVR